MRKALRGSMSGGIASSLVEILAVVAIIGILASLGGSGNFFAALVPNLGPSPAMEELVHQHGDGACRSAARRPQDMQRCYALTPASCSRMARGVMMRCLMRIKSMLPPVTMEKAEERQALSTIAPCYGQGVTMALLKHKQASDPVCDRLFSGE